MFCLLLLGRSQCRLSEVLLQLRGMILASLLVFPWAIQLLYSGWFWRGSHYGYIGGVSRLRQI